ncbi:hypothetical protein CROQUDRAFT_651365 [Cronartium quercuum f. sp. fusiforme G11]|uniref:DNA topoisomerase I n=1 Tax=Cronartium quercuum f. sp. fusiforme G11 TaxID=708437 RepID=A0A9P6THV4_9BASI|nr:hypothetical protein CROQUDRAFT_651365 [Cronartium quercuum f. sp. fusiforme G11]
MSVPPAKLVTSVGRPAVKRIIHDSSSEDDTPVAKRTKSAEQPVTNTETDSDDDDDEPIAAKSNRTTVTTTNGHHPASASSSILSSNSSDDDLPIAAKQSHKRASDGSIDGASSLTTTSDSKPAAEATELVVNKLPKFKKDLTPRAASTTNTKSSRKTSVAKKAAEPDGGSSSDDQPIAAKKSIVKKRPSKQAGVKVKSEDSDFKAVKPPVAKKPRLSKATVTKVKEEEIDEKPMIPLAEMMPVKAQAKLNPKTTASAATSAVTPKKKGKKAVKKEEEENRSDEEAEDEEFKWWEQEKDDDTKKWDTLEHNGVLFPPPYEPLPKDVKMKYNGKPVDLPPESEEVAGFFGSMLNSDHCQKATFCSNFFHDFLEILKLHPPRDGTQIQEFEKCDFSPIFAYYDAERERKKSLTKEEKVKLKKEKDELERPFKFCLLDGRQEKVGNFRVEPPSLFRGRGEHPKTGKLKTRVEPEQITINCSEGAKVPTPPEGHQWQKVMHNEKASWLATWKENINGSTKYVFLAAGSSLKGQSDMKKFEKARALKEHIERIRADYRDQLTDKNMAIRQRATAMYLIDRFALRAGNEKGDDEADTVGCCSLRYEHLTLAPPATVTFDFLGKDSIRFYNTFQVDEQVFKNLKIFKKEPKTVGDMLFDRLSTSTLNKHLSDYMPGLTAKVFRTYNASITFERELEKNMTALQNPTLAEKIYAYNKANREVAVLCNHQKSVSKGHEAQMEKAFEKIKAMKYQRRRLRYQLLKAEGFSKKLHKQFLEDESDLDDDWMDDHEEDLELKERERVTKKFEKDNAALEKEEKPLLDPSVLKERLTSIDGYAAKLKKERKTKDVESMTRAKQVDQLVAAIEKMDTRIEAAKTLSKDRDEGKETSLGTSKLNYIDPRLTYAWCGKYEVPVERMFSKTLREKFPWAAASASAEWKF